MQLLDWWLSQGAASPCSLCLPCCSISSFLFLPGAFIFVGKPSAGRAGNKKMKVVEGISMPLPALLPPALLPAPPQPGMPGDAGAASSTHTLRGGWGGHCCQAEWLASGGDTSMTQPQPTLKAAGDTWGQQVRGGTGVLWCLLSGSRSSCLSFPVGKAMVGRGHCTVQAAGMSFMSVLS